MIKTIHTKKAPGAIGPYSQAIEVNDFIFCSGQIGLDPKTGTLVAGLENQVRQSIKNIAVILEAGDSSLEHVLKTTLFLADMKDFATVNTIYGEYFTTHKPARSTVAVSNLPKNALVEIEVLAVKR